MGILLGMKKEETNNDIKLSAVKAFNDSLNFMEQYFEINVFYFKHICFIHTFFLFLYFAYKEY